MEYDVNSSVILKQRPAPCSQSIDFISLMPLNYAPTSSSIKMLYHFFMCLFMYNFVKIVVCPTITKNAFWGRLRQFPESGNPKTQVLYKCET